jgi:hypothetical protein
MNPVNAISSYACMIHFNAIPPTYVTGIENKKVKTE